MIVDTMLPDNDINIPVSLCVIRPFLCDSLRYFRYNIQSNVFIVFILWLWILSCKVKFHFILEYLFIDLLRQKRNHIWFSIRNYHWFALIMHWRYNVTCTHKHSLTYRHNLLYVIHDAIHHYFFLSFFSTTYLSIDSSIILYIYLFVYLSIILF